MKLIELTPAARLLAQVAGKLRAQRDALLSTVGRQMVQQAQHLMNEQGACMKNLIGHAWNTSWVMFRGEPEPGRNLEVLFARFLEELNMAIAKIEERLPSIPTALSPPLPTTLRELDDLFAVAGTRTSSQALSYAEWTEASLFAPVFKASQVPEAVRRIIAAYRYEVGDFDRSQRAERLFCDLAVILMPHMECYYDDLLVHDRDAIYGMSVGQEGIVVAKESGYGSWFYPTVGAENNIAMCKQRERDLYGARAIAFVTYTCVTKLTPDAASQYWHMATHRALAA